MRALLAPIHGRRPAAVDRETGLRMYRTRSVSTYDRPEVVLSRRTTHRRTRTARRTAGSRDRARRTPQRSSSPRRACGVAGTPGKPARRISASHSPVRTQGTVRPPPRGRQVPAPATPRRPMPRRRPVLASAVGACPSTLSCWTGRDTTPVHFRKCASASSTCASTAHQSALRVRRAPVGLRSGDNCDLSPTQGRCGGR